MHANSQSKTSDPELDILLLLLSVVGGSVDAIVILGFHVLTASQTGNTILLAVSLARRQYADAFYSAVSVAGYMVGAAAGEVILVSRRNDRYVLSVAWALLGELASLICVVVLWRVTGPVPSTAIAAVLVGLTATAMGMQSAAVMRLHLGPATTYITGTLTTFMTETVRSLNLVHSSRTTDSSQSDRKKRSLLWLYGLSWLVYLGGAAAGGILFVRIGEMSLILPLLTQAVVIVAAVLRR